MNLSKTPQWARWLLTICVIGIVFIIPWLGRWAILVLTAPVLACCVWMLKNGFDYLVFRERDEQR